MSTKAVGGSIRSSFPDQIGAFRRSEMSPTLATDVSATVRRWIARARQRRALADLAELNAHLLRDIGLTRDEALREASKWFWQGEERYKVQR